MKAATGYTNSESIAIGSTEKELLLRCGIASIYRRPEGNSDGAASGHLDASQLLNIAASHGMAPLLYEYLDKCSSRNLAPSDIRQKLLEAYRFNVIHTLSMSRELCRIDSEFKENRIPVVAFKGPTFGQLAYGDSCLRSSCDLDFLIKREDLLLAKTLLLANGYKPEFILSAEQEESQLEASCEYCFIHPQRGLMVELHWKIVPDYASFGLSADEIWQHLIPLEFFGRQMMIPSPEYMLLILIVHNGGKHQWERLLWILDIAQLIGSCKTLDWNHVTAIARGRGMSRALGLGLYMAHDLFNAELPESILERLRQDTKIRNLAEEVYRRLFGNPDLPVSRLDHLRFSLDMRNRPLDKIRYCFSQLTMSDIEDRQRFNLPKILTPFYGLMRLGRWLTN